MESVDNKETKRIALSGIQPTGLFHLGNYFGAIRQWVNMIDRYDCLYMVVDMHAISVPQNPAQLRQDSLNCLAQCIACGLDPDKCHLFIQSHVVGHTELAWILGCLTSVGHLTRMTQFKDKSAKHHESIIGAGLLYYPVLQAADILLYNPDFVPVGEDQKQHIELTRDLAQRFNHTYSDTFKIPDPMILEIGARIMSLQEPTAKMSKSDPNKNGTVSLLDAPELIKKKIMSAVTDAGNEIAFRDDKPGVSNLLEILHITTGKPIATLESEFAGKGYADFKSAVADAVIALVEPIQKRYKEVSQDKEYLQGVLKKSAEAMQNRAYKMLSKVYRKVGFVERVR